MASLEQQYRWLLFTYPRTYREERGREVVATLLESSLSPKRLPRLREALGLIVGGLRVRALVAHGKGPRALAADGLRLGATLSLLPWLAMATGSALESPPLVRPHLLPLVLAATVIALWRRPGRWCLLLVLAVFVCAWPGALPTPRDHFLFDLQRLAAPDAWTAAKGLISLYGALVVPSIAFVMPGREPERPGRWPWPVIASLIVLAGVWGWIMADGGGLSVLVIVLSLGPYLAIVGLAVASVVLRDARWGVAGFALTVGLIIPASATILFNPFDLGVLALGLVSAVTAVFAEFRASRI